MRVLYQDLGGKSGAQASYEVLLRTMASRFPDDQYLILCERDSLFCSLGDLANVEMIRFRGGITKEMSRFYLGTIGIGRIARRFGADVIWSNNIGPYVRTGIPQVLMVLNPFQVCPWSLVRYHPDSRVNVAFLRWFFRRSIRKCDAVQVEMPFMREVVRCIQGAPQRVEAIAKAVESTEDLIPRPLPARIQRQLNREQGKLPFRFLFVATCSPHKNQATAVAAMAMLKSRGVAARLVLTITEEECRKCCGDKLSSSLMASGHVLPIGWVTKEELAALYDACDACVMPSYSEQLSSAHLEAMHWKKPQISADLPYAHDLCGDATLYATPSDPVDWANKMEMLLNDPKRRESLVAAGLDRMRTFPKHWKEVAQRVRAFLAEVASQP